MAKKILLGLLIGFVVVVVGGTIAVKVMFPPEKIKEMIVPHIENALGRNVEVSKARVSVFPFIGVTLKEVAISNCSDTAFLQEPFVTLDKFRVKVAFLPLLKKVVLIDEVLFNDVDILIEKSTDGRYNYEDLAFMVQDSTAVEEPKAKSQGMPKLPVPIFLKSFQIKNSSVRIYDHETGQTTTIETINHSIALDMDKSLEKVTSKGALQLADVSVEQVGKPTPVKNFTVTFSHDIAANLVAGQVELKSVKLSLQQIALEVTGGVKDIWAEPEMLLFLKTNPIELADIVAEIPEEMLAAVKGLKAKGTLGLDLTIKGSYKKPEYHGSVTVDDGYLKYDALPKALSSLNLKTSFNDTRVILEDLSFNFGKSPFWMKCLYQFPDSVKYDYPIVDGALKTDLNLSEIGDVIALPPGTNLGGSMEADVTVEGLLNPQKPRKLDLAGELTFKEMTVKTPELKVPAVINGTTRLSAQEILALLKVQLGTTVVDGSLRVTEFLHMVLPQEGDEKKRAKVVMKVSADKLVTADILAEAPPQTGEGDAKAPAKKKAEQALLAPIVLPVDLWLEARLKELVYDEIEVSRVNLSLQSIHETLKLAVEGKMYGGDLTTQIDFRRKDARDLRLKALVVVEDVDANKVFSSYNDQLSDASKLNRYLKDLDSTLYGDLDLRADLTTYGATEQEFTDNVSGRIGALVKDGRIKSNNLTEALSEKLSKFMSFKDITFSDLTFRALVKEGVVTVDTLSLNSKVLADWHAYGTFETNGNLDMKIESRLSKKLSQPLVRVGGKAEKRASGLIDEYLGGTGVDAIAKAEIGKRGVSVDKDDRVTLLIDYGGTLDKPAPRFKGFKQVEGSSPEEPQQTTKEVVKEEVQKEVKKVEKQVKQEVEKAEKQIIKEVEKVGGEEAKKEVKKLFKGLGF